MVLQETHPARELIFVDLALGESHLQEVRGRAVGRRCRHTRTDVRVVVRLRVVEVTYDEVGDRADEEKKQDHDDQPRYAGSPVGTAEEHSANLASRTEGADVNASLYSHAKPLSSSSLNLPVPENNLGRSFVKNP
jgi:hypothetical protein